MPSTNSAFQAAWRLFWLRNLYIFFQLFLIASLHGAFIVVLPLTTLLPVVYGYLLLNAVIYFHLRRQPAISRLEIFAYLLIDLLEFSTVIYLTGGPGNPFISLIFVPIAIAASLLPQFYAWILFLCGAAAYLFSLFFHLPLPTAPNTLIDQSIALSIASFLSYAVGATIIIFLITVAKKAQQTRDNANLTLQNKIQRSESIVAMGTLSASLAHDIGTPLSTVLLILDELEESNRLDEHALSEIQVARQQIFTCKDNLANAISHTNTNALLAFNEIQIDAFIASLANNMNERRPEITMTTECRADANLSVQINRLIELTLTNLLDNAADASLENSNNDVHIEIDSYDGRLTLSVFDNGKGFELDALSKLGTVRQTTKNKGHGIGLVLSNATLDLYDGKLVLTNTQSGGTCAQVDIPLIQTENI